MDSEIATSLINLAAALLIFFAALIPIAYNIWKKADETGAKPKIKASLFIVLNYCLLIPAFAFVFWLGMPWVGMAFFFLNWAMWTYIFLAPKQPPTRLQIFALVVNTVLLGLLAVLAMFETLLQALQS